MSGRRVLLSGLVVVLVLALLAVYGYTVYRLGYERGARAEFPAMMHRGVFLEPGSGRMPRLWLQDDVIGVRAMRFVPGVLSGVGVAALVFLAAVGAVRLIAPPKPAAGPTPGQPPQAGGDSPNP